MREAGCSGWGNVMAMGSWGLGRRGREDGKRQRIGGNPKKRTRSCDKVINFSRSA